MSKKPVKCEYNKSADGRIALIIPAPKIGKADAKRLKALQDWEYNSEKAIFGQFPTPPGATSQRWWRDDVSRDYAHACILASLNRVEGVSAGDALSENLRSIESMRKTLETSFSRPSTLAPK